jgi:hypothetical protein
MRPEETMRELCAFVDLEFSPCLIADIDTRAAAPRSPLPLDPRIRLWCDELTEQLERVSLVRL